MDNAVDALKMAFAMLVFVIAISLSIRVFGQAKTTSDEVFYMADKTNFYEYTSENEKISEGRIVSIETIIPTLYRYYKENFDVIIKNKKGETICEFNLSKETEQYKKNPKDVPWVGNANIDTKKRVDIEVDGKAEKINDTLYNPQISTGLLAYASDSGSRDAKGNKIARQFRETFKVYRYSGKEVTINDKGELEYLDKYLGEENNKDESNNQNEYIDQVGIAGDRETLELVKGNTKIEITYQEI